MSKKIISLDSEHKLVALLVLFETMEELVDPMFQKENGFEDGLRKTCSREILLPQEFLFNVVKDVQSYPLFVPWCKKASMGERVGSSSFYADLTIGIGLFLETYRSLVENVPFTSLWSTLVPDPRGRLEFLTSQWRFHQETGSITRVTCEIHFRLKSQVLMTLVGCNMPSLMISMMDAFDQRAHKLWACSLKDPNHE